MSSKRPKAQAGPTPLTTNIRLSGYSIEPDQLPGIPTRATNKQPADSNAAIWVNSTFINTPGAPPPPIVLKIEKYSFRCGLYLLLGSTAIGKTYLGMSMCGWCNGSGGAASMLYVFEPRAVSINSVNGVLFSEPKNFLDDMDSLKGGTAHSVALGMAQATGQLTSGAQNPTKLLFIDSVTLPLLAYAAKWPNQTTMSGGLQPSSIGFVEKLGKWATDRNVIVIATVNTELVPYASALLGATEGEITLIDIGMFKYVDRSSRNAAGGTLVKIPIPYVQAVLNQYKQGPYQSSNAASGWTPSYSGV